MSDLTVAAVVPPERVAELYAKGYWREDFVTDALDRWVDAAPDRVFIYDGSFQLTWSAVRDQSLALACSLRELGIAPGDRVAVQLPNWHEFAVTYFALARLGAVMVPIMPIYREHEVTHVLTHAGAKAYVFTPAFRGLAYRTLATTLAVALPELLRIAVRTDETDAGEHRFDDLLVRATAATPSPEDFHRPSPDAPHLLVFTSGTESKAKGCLHTWNTYQFTPTMQARLYAFGRDDIELVVSPVTHTTGLAAGLLKPLMAGGSICLMDIWDPAAAIELIDAVRCTHTTAATPFLTMLLDAARARGGGAESLRAFVCGGAPVPPAAIVETARVLPRCKVCTAYGQSELLLCTTVTVDDDPERTINTDGRPIDGLDLKLLGPALEEVRVGEEGEICYRSPGQMLGYWGNPEANAAVDLPGGWRRSGDLGRLRPDGYLRVTGRVKEMLIRGGMNISAREVEDALMSHPTIARAAVVGVPDRVLGDRVGAALVPAPGAAIGVPAVLAYLRDDLKLARQKLPERVLVVDDLPVTATGKILKFELVRRLAETGIPPGG
jgi:cyclohexanecarboxylate-CoA ligase/acyl-CoA synthetase